MKTLIVLRHAKSEHPGGVSDHQRRLNPRGLRDASRVGEVLTERGITPGIVVASSAQRAQMTAELVVESCGYAGEVVTSDSLYEAYIDDILEVVRCIPEQHGTALLVGHNPGFGRFAEILGGSIDAFPTSCWAHLQIDVDHWGEITQSSPSRLEELWYPKLEQ